MGFSSGLILRGMGSGRAELWEAPPGGDLRWGHRGNPSGNVLLGVGKWWRILTPLIAPGRDRLVICGEKSVREGGVSRGGGGGCVYADVRGVFYGCSVAVRFGVGIACG